MFCPVCGAENNEGVKFCRSCGTSFQPGAPASSVGNQGAAMPVAAPYAAPAPNAAMPGAPAPYAAAPSPNAAMPGAPAPGPAMPGVPTPGYTVSSASEGVLGAAWRDITSTQGWFKKVLLLCLVGCVPILNFAVEGYALRWARDLFLGKRETLPHEIFKKKEILTGFRALLVTLALGFIFGVVALLIVLLLSGLFGVINARAGAVVGTIATVLICIAFVVLYLPIINVSVTRMAVVDYLEGALNFPKVLSAFKRAPGGAIGASLVPSLVVAFAQGLVWLVISLILALITYASVNAMGGFDPYAASGYGYMPSVPWGAVGGLMGAGAGVIFLYTVAYIITAMISTFGMLVTWRALGHWAVRNAPEWAGETDEETMARMVEDRRYGA